MVINPRSVSNLLQALNEGVRFEDTDVTYGTQTLNGLSKAYQMLLEEYIDSGIEERELITLSNTINQTDLINNFRKFNVVVQDREAHPPHPSEVPQLTSRILYLISDYNKENDPIEKAAIAQGGIYYIQPFRDGNKRLGRVVSDSILIKNGLNLPTYHSREKYIDRLFSVSDNLKKDKSEGNLLEKIESFGPLINRIKNSQN